ncbi:MAG: 30S ribosomal protein S20 [Deltaproteobacteria bacterium]|nr:30S ribosomal protein S20 [Deltaproteobacteria bacterium]
MPHVPVHPSAEKRQRQNVKRRERNRAFKSRFRTAVTTAQETLAKGNPEQASPAVSAAVKVAYSAASRGVIHKNKAARQVSRLARRLSALRQSPAQPTA